MLKSIVTNLYVSIFLVIIIILKDIILDNSILHIIYLIIYCFSAYLVSIKLYQNKSTQSLIPFVLPTTALLFSQYFQGIQLDIWQGVPSILIALSIFNLIRIEKNINHIKYTFNSALLIGIAVIANPQFLLFILLMPIHLIQQKIFQFKIWLASLIGICLPLFYYFSFQFLWFDNLNPFYGYINKLFDFSISFPQINTIKQIVSLLTSLLVIISVITWIKTYNRSTILIKKSISTIFSYFSLSFISLFIWQDSTYKLPMLAIIIPTSIILISIYDKLAASFWISLGIIIWFVSLLILPFI